MLQRVALLLTAALVAACGGSHAGATPDAGAVADGAKLPDAAPIDAAAPPADALDLGALACPTTGGGGVTATGQSCLRFTPVMTGASAAGENATVDHYALFPTTGANGKLILYFNGSGSAPQRSIADPVRNFFTAATAEGYAVLALSYPSDASLKTLCDHDDGCYFPTRQTIITGVFQANADPSFTQIQPDAGITGRAALALRWLAAVDPAHPWGAFLVPGSEAAAPPDQLAWGSIVTAGHSQGGGHAAAIGKLYPVARVIQLSSTCDDLDDTHAASWLTGSAGTWASAPAQFWGLGSMTVFTGGVPTGGDQTCPTHAVSWTSEGMVAGHQNDAAATCGASGTDNTHGVTIGCADNFKAWRAMLH